MNTSTLIIAFKHHLELVGYGKSCVQMLPACLGEFLAFCNKEVADIEGTDIENYYAYLQIRPNLRRSGGLSESMINHHIYALKLFFADQLEKGNIKASPMSGLSFPTPTSRPRAILTLAEIKLLYGVCETNKERALLSVFYGCGLRRTEGERLNLSDVHFRSGLLYVRKGKGGKRRAVPMSETVKEDLQNYALYERKAALGETAFICNRVGKRMSGVSCNRFLKRLLARTDIQKEISLHSLRHSIATHLLQGGLSVEYVRDFLGHKYLEATQIYTRVNENQLCNL